MQKKSNTLQIVYRFDTIDTNDTKTCVKNKSSYQKNFFIFLYFLLS